MLAKDVVRKLPKIDLHRHLDGDVHPAILFALAEKEKFGLPASSSEELEAYFQQQRDAGIGALLQNGFGLVTSLMQSEENIAIIAEEEVRNLAEDGIIYAEIRFAPQYHTGESSYYHHQKQNKLSYADIIKAVAAGLEEGEKKYGVKTNIIVCIGREAEPEKGIEIAQAALACMDDGVVGIDLACDEAAYPPERHIFGYQSTFGTPLKRTVHAGEFGDRYKNVATAIQSLHAHRLGHALSVANDTALTKIVCDNEIGIEYCPKSNKYCGFIQDYKELLIPLLLKESALVSINSDDPAMFGYTLTDTLYELLLSGELTEKWLQQVQMNAVETAFLPAREKKILWDKIYQSYKWTYR